MWVANEQLREEPLGVGGPSATGGFDPSCAKAGALDTSSAPIARNFAEDAKRHERDTIRTHPKTRLYRLGS